MKCGFPWIAVANVECRPLAIRAPHAAASSAATDRCGSTVVVFGCPATSRAHRCGGHSLDPSWAADPSRTMRRLRRPRLAEPSASLSRMDQRRSARRRYGQVQLGPSTRHSRGPRVVAIRVQLPPNASAGSLGADRTTLSTRAISASIRSASASNTRAGSTRHANPHSDQRRSSIQTSPSGPVSPLTQRNGPYPATPPDTHRPACAATPSTSSATRNSRRSSRSYAQPNSSVRAGSVAPWR